MTGLYFSATWCAPCKRYRPVVEALADLEKIPVQYVDVDDDPALAAAHRVGTVPTLIFQVEDDEVGRILGAVPPARLRQIYDRIVEEARQA